MKSIIKLTALVLMTVLLVSSLAACERATGANEIPEEALGTIAAAEEEETEPDPATGLPLSYGTSEMQIDNIEALRVIARYSGEEGVRTVSVCPGFMVDDTHLIASAQLICDTEAFEKSLNDSESGSFDQSLMYYEAVSNGEAAKPLRLINGDKTNGYTLFSSEQPINVPKVMLICIDSVRPTDRIYVISVSGLSDVVSENFTADVMICEDTVAAADEADGVAYIKMSALVSGFSMGLVVDEYFRAIGFVAPEDFSAASRSGDYSCAIDAKGLIEYLYTL